MTPRLARATYLRDYKIHVTFDDGREGIIDMEGELWGEVFEPLKDTDVFRCFRMVGLIRFGGHLPRGEYDVDHDGHAGQADAAELHG